MAHQVTRRFPTPSRAMMACRSRNDRSRAAGRTRDRTAVESDSEPDPLPSKLSVCTRLVGPARKPGAALRLHVPQADPASSLPAATKLPSGLDRTDTKPSGSGSPSCKSNGMEGSEA